MAYANPDDGYAYTPIELEAIWAIPVSGTDVVLAYENPWQFHRHAAALPNNPEAGLDRGAVWLIERASMAERFDPDPLAPHALITQAEVEAAADAVQKKTRARKRRK